MAGSSQEGTRRRDVLLAGGSAMGLALAGCVGGGSEGEGGGNDTGGGGDGGGSYTVSMAPAGDVEFESVPERVVTYFPGYADMCVALGVEETLIAMAETDRYHTGYYDELDGVSIDKGGLQDILGESGIDREIFYELGADLHLIDPQWLTNNEFFGLDESDVEDVRTNVAPFLGNTIFRRTDEWHDYEYYTLYEAFGKVAQVHQEGERYEAFAGFHDEFVSGVQERLPEERPNALLVFGDGDEPEAFSPYRLADEGTNKKQFHDLGIEDALAGTGIEGLSTTDRGQIDYETMLEVDPDTLLIRGHEDKSAAEFADTVVAFMEDHPVASELTAVQEGNVFRGGPIYQGPIQNLFTTERAAHDFFPEEFGDEELFDRARVAEIVAGR
ncbi:ABC transporter substrate-binding protein [Halalkalicoccus sp. NIPERK01]|uniref:ABC transporter substrate-binding protein n=1 Tax=Halalkalicoccus sp. NIPERK01 TaxID=3053469 RepID=UPI00256EEEC5|nr:ABC transporter substrate-binding protein [Halalkalicoccus sp. NIPERK01]MDL5362278.1 ABC transporter substrate-binding protein [Halalkalicoccus sp. NIPERK01]